ncbi:hypothetical protein Q5P01_017443 [Channa striata]|uniref:Uncharacterized protein n=1 Tax=Channa striata TaxID=64152 RepID=A0AA88SBK4_CHASR|nr:hypothetical protein Q5P01_017443 [Channa striata]
MAVAVSMSAVWLKLAALLCLFTGLSCSGDQHTQGEEKWCSRSGDLILVSVMISVGVVLSIIMSILIWLIKTKTGNPGTKTGCAHNNGVYEEMRGTHIYNITN